MKLGIVFSPASNWQEIFQAALLADKLGLDSVGFWDHYHSMKPEWGYVCGWASYGAIACATERVKLVPMVICNLNYALGVMAKETSILALISDGRFELGIGAGDYPEEYAAWNLPYPDAEFRIALLRENMLALREVWQGKQVTFNGQKVKLQDATCAPPPSKPPRIIVGAGKSKKLIRSALEYADEINIYADQELVKYTKRVISNSNKPIGLSVYLHFDWDQWPQDISQEIAKWKQVGIDRLFINIGYEWPLQEKVREIASAIID